MKVYRASELQAFLQELGIDARKGLSQNFLIDGNILRKIIAAARIQPGDHVIEIGPGPGALTQLLLEQGARVTAIELDKTFAEALHRLQTEDHALTVISHDVLKFPLADFLKDSKKKWKVVANLPYHITTPILTQLLPLYPLLDSITIMVQKEYAKRMASAPDTPDYSSLSLFVRFYAAIKYCFTVEPTCFYPRPKVQSAVVHCQLHPHPPVSSVTDFFILTRAAFQKRRKMLRASLKEIYPTEQILKALATLHLSDQTRPEQLSLEQFLALFEILYNETPQR